MTDQESELRARLASLEQEVADLRGRTVAGGVRRRSKLRLFGLPLYDIAMGPDPARGELRGHARGVVAIGDLATGVVACGGLARGGIAIGGLAVGVIALGGAAFALLFAFGGLAVGTVAVGGGAAGYIAFGGAAAGEYAFGGEAFGSHVVDHAQRDPEALALLERLPWLRPLLPPALR